MHVLLPVGSDIFTQTKDTKREKPGSLSCQNHILAQTVEDPGFPREDANPMQGAPMYYLVFFMAENCMKMKNIGPRGCAS